MGRDKALIAIDGMPLWERQLRLIKRLNPMQTFLAGPPRSEWDRTRYTVIADVLPGAGPLSGLAAALRECAAPHLLALAVDLPQITSEFLAELLAACRNDVGVVPRNGKHFEPVAAVYPKCCLPAATEALEAGRLSLQNFAARGVGEGWLVERLVSPQEAPLFVNMNTPDDLAAVVHQHA